MYWRKSDFGACYLIHESKVYCSWGERYNGSRLACSCLTSRASKAEIQSLPTHALRILADLIDLLVFVVVDFRYLQFMAHLVSIFSNMHFSWGWSKGNFLPSSSRSVKRRIKLDMIVGSPMTSSCPVSNTWKTAVVDVNLPSGCLNAIVNLAYIYGGRVVSGRHLSYDWFDVVLS